MSPAQQTVGGQRVKLSQDLVAKLAFVKFQGTQGLSTGVTDKMAHVLVAKSECSPTFVVTHIRKEQVLSMFSASTPRIMISWSPTLIVEHRTSGNMALIRTTAWPQVARHPGRSPTALYHSTSTRLIDLYSGHDDLLPGVCRWSPRTAKVKSFNFRSENNKGRSKLRSTREWGDGESTSSERSGLVLEGGPSLP